MNAATLDDEQFLERVVTALRGVFDPEIPTNIYDLGLIYAIDRLDEDAAAIRMTLTAPGCPVAGSMPGMVRNAVESAQGINRCRVELVWEPPWDKSRMSEAALLELGML